MTNDHRSRDDDPSLATTPRQDHPARPDHPVMRRPDAPAPGAQVPTPPPQGGGGLMHLFEDEDAPTSVYKDGEQTSPQEISSTAEESVLLVPDPNLGAAPGPARPAAAPAPPWAQPPAVAPVAATAPSKKKSRALLVIGILLGVVVVLGGAALGVALFLFSGTEAAAPEVEARAPTPAAPVERLAAPSIARSGAAPVTAPIPVPITPEPAATPTAEAQAGPLTGAREGEPPVAARGGTGNTGLQGRALPDPTAAPVEPPPVAVAAAPTATAPAPIEGELASQLAPLTDAVRECTRRESGYSPRSLTVTFVPLGTAGVRLSRVAPPTPPRVVHCMARAFEGLTWAAPAGVGQVSYTFRLQAER